MRHYAIGHLHSRAGGGGCPGPATVYICKPLPSGETSKSAMRAFESFAGERYAHWTVLSKLQRTLSRFMADECDLESVPWGRWTFYIEFP